jgi:hypothetical protein
MNKTPLLFLCLCACGKASAPVVENASDIADAASLIIAGCDASASLLGGGTLVYGGQTGPGGPGAGAGTLFSAPCASGGMVSGAVYDLGGFKLDFDGCEQNGAALQATSLGGSLSIDLDCINGQGVSVGYEFDASGPETINGENLNFDDFTMKVVGLSVNKAFAELSGSVTYHGKTLIFDGQSYPFTSLARLHSGVVSCTSSQ